jgi:tRNA modification GTPase
LDEGRAKRAGCTMPRSTDTIAALATPVGTAALALLRISGPDTVRLARECAGGDPAPRVARHVDYRDQGGTLLDDVVLTYFAAPRSYTGEDALEISCHGNPYIAQRILEDLFARGCRPAEPGEFTQRAFLNGRLDLSQAEAVMDLIHARGERALAAANAQLRGALGQRLNAAVDVLLGVLARVEAYIDFPEEDLPPEDRGELGATLEKLAADTDRLLATTHYGEMLRDGIRTVIVGAPNVGKSSLLNRLVGRERALVSAEPGTTRDFIEERIMVGPHSLRLIDTAGLNPSPAPLERLGMAKTHERLAEADLTLLVLDASNPAARPTNEVLERIRRSALLVVWNKCDVAGGAMEVPESIVGAPSVRVSALTGLGFESLCACLVERAEDFQRAAGGETIAINSRHAHALGEAREALSGARQKLAAGTAPELLAADLRAALNAYGEIIGKVDNERMLDQLFAAFCIGK